ncbi:MAG: DUF4129 domain-containing protein [Thermoplasmata archaeon]
MDRQTYEKLLIAFLLMAFVFALGNLVFNLENLYIGDESFPEFVMEGGIQSQGVATNETLADAVKWIWFGFLAVCGFVLVIGAVSFGKSKDKKKWRKLMYQIAGVLLAIGMIFAFGYFYEDIESSVMGIGTTDRLSGGGGNTTDGNVTGPPGNPDALKTIIAFGVFALIFIFCIVVLLAINNILKMRSAKLDYSDIERDKQVVAQTIQRTIDAIAGGSDTRATVIRCYTDMCKVMSKYGVKEEEHLTPREFLKLAVANLPVPEGQMRALVDVFEEARYSHHKLGETDSAKAVKALEAVKVNLLAAKKEPGGAQDGP